MQTDVKAGYRSTTGLVLAGRNRIKGILIAYASGGTVDLYDTGTSPLLGQAKAFQFVAPAAAGSVYIPVPGEGILCADGMYATLSSATVTVFYG
jgi:hypothetical protein